MSRKLTKILLVVALSCLLLGIGLIGKQYGEESNRGENEIEVIRAIDGDSVAISVNGRRDEARLTGIDAPEMGQRPWGRRAREHLKDLIFRSSGKPSIEYDVERRDKYGRLLAYIRTGDGRLVNSAMLRDGYAVLFTVPPNVRYVKKFREDQAYAREQRLGIWARGGLKELPSDYRREHPRR
jgi:micrococcal nuclease